MNDIKPIETRYAGCRFRSRLEARWAVFFDAVGASWEYEPQGFAINGKPYLPDFLLTDCGTWVEVKGDPADLDRSLMVSAALSLPRSAPAVSSGSPTLLILGTPPGLPTSGDWAWLGLTPGPDGPGDDAEKIVYGGTYTFNGYRKHRSPVIAGDTSCADSYTCGEDSAAWLTPEVDMVSTDTTAAYQSARSARFEHGQHG